MISVSGYFVGGRRFRQPECDSHGQAEAASVECYIEGMEYPCSKVKLIHLARLRHAPCDILFLLHKMLQSQFANSFEVGMAVGAVVRLSP